MTGPRAGRQGLRDAQLAQAARAALLAATVLTATVLRTIFLATTLLTTVLVPALVAGHWTPVGGAALAVGVLGSGAAMVAVWAVLAPVVLQALALQGVLRRSVPRERISAALAIRRPEEPGRPGRARPRAPGAVCAPGPAC